MVSICQMKSWLVVSGPGGLISGGMMDDLQEERWRVVKRQKLMRSREYGEMEDGGWRMERREDSKE
jgi:hypothetical protein